MQKIKVVSVSAGDGVNSLLWKNRSFFNKNTDFAEVEINLHHYNKNSLASIYNQYITEEYKDYIVVFVHDDVFISDGNFCEKCVKAVELFDVFGVAGGTGAVEIPVNTPALWHLMCNKKVGYAGHYKSNEIKNDNPFTTCWMTSFGYTPFPATLVDGVFFGINVGKVLNTVRFDEHCPSRFHFYDLLFCINAKRAGLRVGVFPFNIFHQSPGLQSYSDEFNNGDLYFKNYCNTLI